MVQVIRNPSLSSMLGSQVGAGVGEGISKGFEQLASLRSQDLLKRQQRSDYTGLGYSPEEADFIQNLPEKSRWEAIQALAPQGSRESVQQEAQQEPISQQDMMANQVRQQQQQGQVNPQDLIQILQALGGLQNQPISNLQDILSNQQRTQQQQPFAPQAQQAPSQKPINTQSLPIAEAIKSKASAQAPVQRPQALQQPIPEVVPQQQETARERIARSRSEKPTKKLSAAQEKHKDSLISQEQNLRDLVETTDRMIQELESGKVDYGIIASTKAKYSPSSLGQETERFDKDSAHLINLSSENIKGVPSKYRVQLIEQEKPSLRHSPEVNKKILQNFKLKAERKLNSLYKEYPAYFEGSESTQESGQSGNTFESLDQLSNNPEGTIVEDEDSGLRYIKRGNQWQPLK